MFLLSPSIVSAVIIRFIVIRLIVIWRIILRFGIEDGVIVFLNFFGKVVESALGVSHDGGIEQLARAETCPLQRQQVMVFQFDILVMIVDHVVEFLVGTGQIPDGSLELPLPCLLHILGLQTEAMVIDVAQIFGSDA